MHQQPKFYFFVVLLTLCGACQSESVRRQSAQPADNSAGDANARIEETSSGRDDGIDRRLDDDETIDEGTSDSNDDDDDDDRRNDDDMKALPGERTAISFAGSRGDTVPGYLWLPENSEGKKVPVVLAMYGISGNKDSGTIADIAEVMTRKGLAVMTIDWPGTGDRGDISKQKRVTSIDVLDWTTADYARALDFLEDRPEIDADRIGFVGASMGAMTGLAFAADDRRIRATVAIVPIPNPLWGSKAPSKSVARMGGRNLYCLYTTSDFSNLVCESGSNVKTQSLAGGHELENLRGEVAELALDYLLDNL